MIEQFKLSPKEKRKIRFAFVSLYIFFGALLSLLIAILFINMYLPFLLSSKVSDSFFREILFSLSMIVFLVLLGGTGYFYVIPKRLVKNYLRKNNLEHIKKGHLKYFYTGWYLFKIPSPSILKQHCKKYPTNIHTLLKQLQEKENIPISTVELFYHNPKRHVITLYFCFGLLVCSIWVIGVAFYIEWIAQNFMVFYLLGQIWVDIIPGIKGKRFLLKAGYKKLAKEDAWSFFICGGCFMKLPHYEDITLLPDFDKNDVISLLVHQFQYFNSKHGKKSSFDETNR